MPGEGDGTGSEETSVPWDLRFELLGVAVLGLGTAVLCVLWLVRRRRPGWPRLAAVALAVCLGMGMTAHGAWRLENYCNQPWVHVECVSDDYDASLQKVFRTTRYVYHELRRVLLR